IRAMSGNAPDCGVKPRIHWSVAELWQSSSVFAEDSRERDAWRIDYRPFNVHELNRTHGHLRKDSKEDWPFEWIERPSDAYI
ncbi:MAG: hypothetical protein ACT4P8_16635, partial [Betaproteobacteria bacterium]